MHEIDLVPREHHERRRTLRALRRGALLLVLIVAAAAAGRAWLAWQLARERPLAEQFRQAEKDGAAQRARLAELGVRRTELEARLATLGRLQAGAGWDEALQHVDRAHGRGIWLDRLAIGPGAADGAAPARHALELHGHALDHAAVSEFMRRMAAEPGLQQVRLTDTGLRRYSALEVVDFSLSARLAGATQERP